jgi:hypothetical protein
MNLILGRFYSLHETRLSATSIEGDLRAQIADYIPEIDG